MHFSVDRKSLPRYYWSRELADEVERYPSDWELHRQPTAVGLSIAADPDKSENGVA